MSVVTNASPLIGLARIGELELLQQLYGELVIPEAVEHEVVVEGAELPAADQVGKADWIKTRTVSNKQLVRVLQENLGAGEAEAIALALEIEAELLLLDEHRGRQTALHLGLRYTGLVGILIEAKSKGYIDSVKGYLNSLRDVAGFYVSERLYMRVIQDRMQTKPPRSYLAFARVGPVAYFVGCRFHTSPLE